VFGPCVHWGRDKALLDKRIAERRGKPLDPWRQHDLRHTFVTTMNELGFAEPHVVESIRYNHAVLGAAHRSPRQVGALPDRPNVYRAAADAASAHQFRKT